MWSNLGIVVATARQFAQEFHLAATSFRGSYIRVRKKGL